MQEIQKFMNSVSLTEFKNEIYIKPEFLEIKHVSIVSIDEF